ncbi:SLBP2 / Histone RNA hairpin-binding protein RNA-binding domain containing protein [Leishmania donovani]|uniref:Histone_RNA_hairpin-binding_protein_RNA-binding_d omain_containing_protein_putative/Pfam:PF15247 n=1 Tax=Leishmania donovani TaxID=5661 RepID=A0A6J8FD75_LEIDO|nr:SLBP2 / Histone RNA hairpin-binding protein RNA-binding domain containing protein [Leishmania donovani]VDZ45286.1 Histone_RNA_hairpin-binding_protein_RNA-binding_domain_containing_protein_putative/Pfam:PF15247 [Leishmania donovani]
MQKPQQSFTTLQRAARDGGSDSHAKTCARQTPENCGVLLKGSRSLSPAPCFPGDDISPSARQHSQQDHHLAGTPLKDHRPPSSQPREPSHAPQRRHPHKQQQQLSPGFNPRGYRGDGERGVSGSGAPNDWWQRTTPLSSKASPLGSNTRPRKLSPSGNSPDEGRRRSQREKQIQFGYVTDGYTNMKRLIAHDPLLRSGGILPLSPPDVFKGSKRLWDIQLRKWRRALHMFDYVFIDGEDRLETRAKVLEEQRRQWVSEAFNEMPREARLKIDLDTLRGVQCSSAVPSRIPIEEDLRCILRSDDCYESVRSVVPQSASSLTKGTDISPLEAGIKIHIAPSAAVLQRQQAQLEMQQRLSSLHQQQQQQQALATEVAPEGMETGSHVPSAPPVLGATVECAAAERPVELSPSPRRPPLPLPSSPSPSHVSCPSPQQKARETTPHRQLCCSPLPRMTAAPVPAAFGSAETAPGISASQPRALSLSGSSAPVQGASLGLPGMSATAAVLAPPPPFSGPTPCIVPNMWMPGVTVSPTPAAAARPLMSWCSHCGHCIDLPAPAITGAPYGGMCAGTPGGRGGVLEPAQVPPQHVNPVAVAGTSGAMMPPSMQFRGAMPYMSRPTNSMAAAAVVTSPLYWQMLAPPAAEWIEGGGTFTAHHGSSHSQYRQSEARQDAFAAMPRSAATVAGRSCPRDGHRRSSGAVATGGGAATPQTVPRFVARLSTSPNEVRLGERQSAERLHSAEVASGVMPAVTRPLAADTRAAAAAPAPLRQPSSVFDDAADAARMEKSQSALAVTPERKLFGTGIIADVTTESRPVVVGALQQDETPQGTPSGKPRPTREVEDAPVVPLVFDGDE